MTTASGERLAFSVIVNNLPGSSAAQRRVIDDIILLLANFNGKSN
jgi:D-alanyl-D-alanine carboxypeptidase